MSGKDRLSCNSISANEAPSPSPRAWLGWLLASIILVCCSAPSLAEEPINLKIVGGLAGVSQYNRLERPFWEEQIGPLSQGRLHAEIFPFDRNGLPGQEMLQLIRLGVVPFGTALLAVVSADEPELNAVDLPGLNPDMATLRKSVAAYRPHLEQQLRQKFGVELLAIYAYPAQVLFCAKSFSRLQDLAGRRVRTSSVGQSELMTALGATPVLIPFNEIVSALRSKVVDCAITGTMSGAEIGLSNVTSYISPVAISWGLSLFGANAAAWQALPDDARAVIREGVRDLEAKIWQAADSETAEGLACNIGSAACGDGRKRGNMQLVPATAEDEVTRRTLLINTVLPQWIERCGAPCASAWNTSMASAAGIRAPAN